MTHYRGSKMPKKTKMPKRTIVEEVYGGNAVGKAIAAGQKAKEGYPGIKEGGRIVDSSEMDAARELIRESKPLRDAIKKKGKKKKKDKKKVKGSRTIAGGDKY
jgi:hypothetical protein